MSLLVLVVDDFKLFWCSVICVLLLELEVIIEEVINGKEVIDKLLVQLF